MSEVLNNAQLELFKIEENDRTEYSNYIEFYQALPIWTYDKKKKYGDPNRPFKTEFVEIGQKQYTVEVSAGPLKQQDGNAKYLFPGLREELIQDALLKLATTEQVYAQQSDKQEVGSYFSMKLLQRMLKETGHSYDVSELKEGINVLGACSLEVSYKTEQGKKCIVDSGKGYLFTAVYTRTVMEGNVVKGMECQVRFHPLITKGIRDKTFRQYDYVACMEYSKPLTRWIHKHLTRQYRFAEYKGKPYHIKTSNLIQNSPFKKLKSWSDNARKIEEALFEMIYHKENNSDGILEKYEREKDVADPVFKFYASPMLEYMMKRANAIQNKVSWMDEQRKYKERYENELAEHKKIIVKNMKKDK